MKKLLGMLGIFVLSFMLIIPVSAATFGSGEEYFLTGDQIIEGNLYISGATLMLDGEVKGDLITAGANIWSNGTIGQDANIAGANLTINSKVGDDLRAAGANININSEVGGELVAAGAYIIISSNTVIEKDAIIAGARVLIDGTIKGNLDVRGDEIEIKGTVEGNVVVNAQTSLKILEGAVINGNLTYKAPEATNVPADVVKGETEYNGTSRTHEDKDMVGLLAVIASVLIIGKLILSLVFGIVLYFVFRKFTRELLETGLKNFWINALRGFATVILLPIAIVIVLVTVIGIPFSVLAGLVFLILCMLSKVLAGMLFGTLVFRIFTKNKDVYTSWYAILVGILLLSFFGWIPVLGWLLKTVMYLSAFGALGFYVYKGLGQLRK